MVAGEREQAAVVGVSKVAEVIAVVIPVVARRALMKPDASGLSLR